MKGDALFAEPLFYLLSQKEVDFNQVKSLAIEAYNKENDQKIDMDSATEEEQIKVIRWLRSIKDVHDRSLWEVSAPLLHTVGFKEVAVKTPLFSICLTEKVHSLAYLCCPICRTENGSPRFIPLKINPESKQALARIKGLRAAYEKAIKSAFAEKEMSFLRCEKLCVLVVFILGNGNKEKDLDNMSKAMMDALQKSLFANDADIDHLNLFKIRHENPDSFVYINIRRTDLNEHYDVLIKKFDHVMLVPGIDEFFEEERKRLKVLRKIPKGK